MSACAISVLFDWLVIVSRHVIQYLHVTVLNVAMLSLPCFASALFLLDLLMCLHHCHMFLTIFFNLVFPGTNWECEDEDQDGDVVIQPITNSSPLLSTRLVAFERAFECESGYETWWSNVSRRCSSEVLDVMSRYVGFREEDWRICWRGRVDRVMFFSGEGWSGSGIWIGEFGSLGA